MQGHHALSASFRDKTPGLLKAIREFVLSYPSIGNDNRICHLQESILIQVQGKSESK